MLTDTVGDLLPSALGVALSPVPIIAVVLMLGTPRARSQGAAFAIGWVLGLTIVSTVVVLVAGAGDPSGEPSALVGWLKIVLGLLFLLLAVRQWRTRPTAGAEAPTPAWMDSIDSMPATRTTLVGAALSGLNPKNLALTIAAAATIGQADLSGPGTGVAVAVFVAVGSVTVVGPVIISVIAPSRTAAPLRSVKVFLSTHNAAIMIVVLLLLGAKLLGSGLATV